MAGIANGQTPTANVSGITSSTNYLVAGDPNFSPAFSATGQGAILTINGATIGTDASRATGAGGHASLISLGGNNGVVLPNDQDYGDLTLNLEGSILLYGRGSAIVEGIYIKTKSVDSTNTVNFNASNSVVDVTTSAVGSGNSNYTNTILAENQAASGGGTIVNITGDNNSFKTNYTGATVREMGTGANIYASGRKQAVINITGDNTTVESRGLAATGLSASSSTTAIINITGSNTQIRTDSVGIYANGGARASVNITGPGSSITTTAANAHGISTSSSAGSIRIDTTANITTAGTASDAIRAIATGSGAIDIGDAVTPITGTLTTTGHGAHGIETVNSGTGNINIHSAAEITTGGNSSHGIYASASAPVTSSAININNTGAITTSGTGAMGIHASGSGSGKITINNTGDLVTTSTATVGGTYSHAIHAYVTATGASDGIEINHANGSITTAAYDATGIRAESTATSGDITVTVTDANITANGVNGDGILVQTKGLNGTDTDINITTNGGSINILETPSQTGNGSANYGIAALHITGTGALADATGDINIDNNGTDISTGTGATGVANAASAIYAHQQTAAGAAFTAQGDIRITSTGDLSTLGGNSHGIHALISGTAATGNISIGVNDSGAAAPVSGKIATAGAASHGIYASNAGSGAITINNAADITTGGAGSYGIHAVIANPASDGDIIINNSGNISATQNSPTRAIATLHAGSGNTYIASTGNFDPGSTTQLAHLIHATHAASSSGGIFIGYNADGSEAPITGTFASQGGGFGILAQHLGANATINIKVGDDASFTNTIATKNNGEGVIHAIYKPDASIADADNKADINLDIGKARLDLKNGSPSTAYSDGVVSVMNRGLYGTITVASAAEINSHNAAGYRIQAGATNSNVNIRLGTDTAPITGSITTTGTSSPGYHVYSGEVRAGGNIEIHNAATIDATGNRAYGIFIDQRVRDDLTDSLNLVRNTGDITTRTEGGAEDGGGGIRVSMGTLGTGGDASQIKIINDGKIDTDRTGIYAASHKGAASVTRAGEIDITNNGVIEAATYGIYARHYNTLGDLTIRNTGSITFANAIAPSSTTAPSGIHAEAIDGLMEIDNAGDISINSVSEPNAHGINAVKTGTTGDIYINNAADIETTGNASHGIHAQAAGDSNISVRSTGDITTTGTASYGIYAQITGTASTGTVTIGTAANPISGAITNTGNGGHSIYASNAGNGDSIIHAAATVSHTGDLNGTAPTEGIVAHSAGAGSSIIHYTGAKVEVTGFNADALWAQHGGTGSGNAQIYATGEIIAAGSGSNPQGIVAHVGGTGQIAVEYTGTHILAGNAATISGNAINAGHNGASGNVTVTSNNADSLIETLGADSRGIRAYTSNTGNNGDIRIGYTADRVGATDTLADTYTASAVSGTIRTAGDRSHGIMAFTTGGTGAMLINNAATIETGGSSAHGISATGYDSVTKDLLQAAGSITINNTGDITTNGNEAHGLHATGTGDISITNSGAIITTGTFSHGIYVVGKSGITIDNNAGITTGAKSAHGILVNANSGNGDVSVTHATGKITIEDGSDDTGAGSWLNGAGVAVYISKSGTGNVNLVIDGDIETHAQNRGAGAYIHAMNNIGDLSITGSGNILAAADIPESTGTNVYSYGLAATINGSAVRNDGKVTITYSSGTIETRGNSAYALYAGVTSGTTPGGANSAAAIINTGRLITAGGSSSAIYARTENTEGAAIVVNSGNINTSGTSSHGIHAYSGSVSANARNNAETNSVYLAALTTTPAPGSTSTIATTGDYSHGIYAVGSGARIVSTAETTNISTTGSTSYGIHAANGAILSFKNGSITTTGDLSFGAAASGAGTLFTSTLALDNFNITTAGNMAHAAFANYDAFVSITGGTLTTTSANASTAVIKASGYDNTPGADRGGKLVAQNTTLIAKNNAVAVTVDNAGTIETTNATITSETGAILFGTDNQPVGAPLGSSVTIKTGAITAAAELVRAVNTTGTLTLDGVTSVANGTNAISFHASATNTNALRVILDNATSVTGDIIGGRQGETTPDDTLWSYTAATGSNTLNLDLLNGSQFHVRRATSGDYTYNHRTTADATSVLKISLADGSGTNLIALGTNAAADMVNDFRGTLALGNGRFILGGAANSQGATNMSALANATLRLDALNRTAVEGAGAIAGLSFNGGTLAVRTSGSTGVNFVEDLLTVSGTLDASGGGTVEVALSGTVHNIIPATPPSAPALLDQDNYIETGTAGMMQNQLVAATGTVRNIGTQLSINFIPSSTSSGTITGAVSSTSALVQSGTHVADLTYDYYGTVTGSGIYLNYGLAQIDALAGQTVQISTDGATDNTLGAILSGSGNYTFTATDGMNIRVGNGLSDYTGATTIATGTVTAITDNALGATSRLTLDPGSVLNLDGHEQTVHGQVVAAENSAINTGGGVLNVTATTTGSVRTGMGIYAGNAKINADGGSLNVDILTGGDAAHAVYSAAGSSITITSGTLRTTGAGASALTSTGSSVINASRVDISLTGSKSYGAYASNGGVINLADSAIATSGFYGLGVVADGGGAVVTATNVSIATTGASAHGVYLGNPGDATVSLVNTAITTTGPNAHGVDITPHTSGTVGARTVTIDGGSMHTAGDIINVGYIEVPKGSAASNANLENQAVVTIKNIGSAASLVAETGNILNVQTARTGTDGSVTNVPTTVTLNVENSSLSGNIITDNAIADVSVLLKNATALTGKIDIANVNIDATSSWTLTASSDVNNLTLATGAKISFGAPAADNTVFKTLRVHGNLAGGVNTITMSANLALLRGDLLRIDGATTGSYTLDLSNHGGNPTRAGQRLMIVQAANEADFSLTGPQYRDAGLYRYYWVKGETDPANWYLANPTGTGDEPSPYSDAGQTIVNSASLLGLSWHYGMDSLHKRMGDVRAENLAANAPLTGNVWMRGYTYRLNALSPMRSSRFSQDTYGITAGADKALRNSSANATWLLGAFIDMGGTDRDFRNADDGSSTNVGLGLYATWLGDAGWYADIVLRADRYKHDFESRPYGGATVSGDYTSKAQGLSVEFGRMLKRADGWWLEPSVQISQGWLNGDTYETESSDPGNRMTVRVSDSDTLQYRGQLRFGRQLLSSRWHPYGKIGAARVDANGGEITALDTKVGPTYRGWRMEAGLGAAYRIDDGSQVYLDYEYAKAPAYERPWSLSLGYRRMW
ncbi:autotransporter outer membrane beta-barrel domain-containing protein [Ereboglobus sp. PH5-10]|uniref:autotransporter outer membrane beta-barrel domain-containing protein n=1 Tax=Ereboglobus sp. PH5-10 TaxID=2940629 RepID=UPI00240497B1|nr:autotransporter outer membrane beta-barrel domain-containing protein [Ereboglobus sp. PH5-10]